MTKKIIASYAVCLSMTIALIGISDAHASEVTGVLSSHASTTENSQTTGGSISGTVTSDSSTGDDDNSGSGSSSGSSSSGSRSGGSSSDATQGSVLGASIDNTQTPSFPNAGAPFEEGPSHHTLWSVVKTFFWNTFSF